MPTTKSILGLSLAVASKAYAATTLFNGLQSAIFPTTTSAECLASFNTSLQCDPLVSRLYMQTDWVGWNATNLTALCTPECHQSLTSLKEIVTSNCADLSIPLGGSRMDAEKIVDFYEYKYNLTCLADGSSWCLLEQDKWFVEYLPTVTWPQYTDKWYPDWINDPLNGTNAVDENGTVLLPYDTVPPPQPTFNSGRKAALDYRYIGKPPAEGTLNSSLGLEYDEYPLEIQCSPCFLQRFKLGFMSRWGETYNEVKAQAWANIQKNCGFQEDLYVFPVLDQSGPPRANRAELQWTGPSKCARTVTLDALWVNCSTFSVEHQVATASLRDLNRGINCRRMDNGTYCLPEPCDVAKIWVDGGIWGTELIKPDGPYSNISYIQFMRWNAAALHEPVFPGDTICIGPPGGAYAPPAAPIPVSPNATFTTTAVPAMGTPPGTVSNCGLYYDTVTGDDCNMIAMKYSITFSQLRLMNPQINADCTNLWANTSYCVALVSGTTVITTASSSATPTRSSSSGSTSPSPTSSTVAPPAPTQPGATSSCYEWYVAVPGDDCSKIDTQYGITFAQLRAWNLYLDSTCSNLWSDYAYCVKGA
ncbi:hypothetical protein KXW37_006451 [Aspergillus fumigatus]|nr:hypothetical protein KXW37_006451 [Aspergillus fumigatus]